MTFADPPAAAPSGPQPADHNAQSEREIQTALQAVLAESQAGANYLLLQELWPPLTQSIMPVMTWLDGQLRWVGTAFAISAAGHMATARHVIRDFYKDRFNRRAATLRQGALLVIWERPELSPTHPGTIVVVPQVLQVVEDLYPDPQYDRDLDPMDPPLPEGAGPADVAVFRVKPLHNQEAFVMPKLALELRPPEPGTFVTAIGFHQVGQQVSDPVDPDAILGKVEVVTQGDPHNAPPSVIDYTRTLVASTGEVTTIKYKVREGPDYNFPRFDARARFNPGLSGSPVFSASGKVCGIVSMGEQQDPDVERVPHGTVSMLGALFDLSLSDVSVWELADAGVVDLDIR